MQTKNEEIELYPFITINFGRSPHTYIHVIHIWHLGTCICLDCLCKLKRRLDSAAGMIDSYEQAWEEKNKELQKYKVSMITGRYKFSEFLTL